MKQLQNDFTTPEQSKRLLELGVPADSADCYRNFYYEHGFSRVYERWYDHELHKNFFTRVKGVTPCWSVGQLMKIVFISMGKKDGMLPRLHFEYDPTKEINIIEDLVDLIEYPEYKLDFSKLED